MLSGGDTRDRLAEVDEVPGYLVPDKIVKITIKRNCYVAEKHNIRLHI